MKLNPFYLLRKINSRVACRLPVFTAGKGSQCGTQNQANRDAWVERTLANIPSRLRILDAGAGELRYKSFCAHLDYVSQDFAQYDGQGDGAGLQMGSWGRARWMGGICCTAPLSCWWSY